MRVHLERLTQLEYVLVHRGGRGQSFDYELLYEGEGQHGDTFLMGLLDVEQLKNQKTVIREESVTTTKSSRGTEGEFAGSKRPLNGAVAAPMRKANSGENTDKNGVESDLLSSDEDNACLVLPHTNNAESYRSSPLAAVIAEG